MVIIMGAGCAKEKPEVEPAAKAKILGAWKLEKRIDETWQPVNILVEELVETGTPGDSAIFKEDDLVYSYQDRPTGVYEEILSYEFPNDSTIRMDEENYVIRKLTATELYLHQEETEGDVKDVVKIFLVR
jgi:hypothetical protein